MAKTLSQEETDALFSEVSSGEAVAKEAADKDRDVPSYDWRHPRLIARDQLRALEDLHTHFARSLSSSFSTLQRTMVSIIVTSVEQLAYSEFIASLSNPSCSMMFSMEPLEGTVIINFSSTIAFSFIDRLLGGRGRIFDPDRELTDIEKNVMQKVAMRALEDLQVTWSRVMDVKMRMRGVETNPQFIRITSPNETAASVSLGIEVQNISGFINLCYPYTVLRPTVAALSTQRGRAVAEGRDSEEEKGLKAELLNKVYVTLKANLGETIVTMNDLTGIQVGDVLCLDTRINDEIVVLVEESSKFLARPGLVGKNMAVQIVSSIEEGGES